MQPHTFLRVVLCLVWGIAILIGGVILRSPTEFNVSGNGWH